MTGGLVTFPSLWQISASNAKEKIMKLFKKNVENNVPKEYKPKHISGSFDDKNIEWWSEGDEQLSIEQFI